MTPRAVLLDLGNVLAFHDNRLLFSRLGDAAGLSAAEVESRMFQQAGWDAANRGELDETGIHQRACAALGLSLPSPEFSALFCCHFRVHHAVLPVVASLFGVVKVGLISNTNAIHAAYLRGKLPILQRFDSVVLSNEAKVAKPDVRIFERALHEVGVAARDAVFFDDLPEYVAAAERAGLHARLFTTAGRFQSDLAELGVDAGNGR